MPACVMTQYFRGRTICKGDNVRGASRIGRRRENGIAMRMWHEHPAARFKLVPYEGEGLHQLIMDFERGPG